MEIDRQFLEARADAAALLEPADALLDHGSLAIGGLDPSRPELMALKPDAVFARPADIDDFDP